MAHLAGSLCGTLGAGALALQSPVCSAVLHQRCLGMQSPAEEAHPASDTTKLWRAASKRAVPGAPNSRRKISYRLPSAVSPSPALELQLGTTCTCRDLLIEFCPCLKRADTCLKAALLLCRAPDNIFNRPWEPLQACMLESSVRRPNLDDAALIGGGQDAIGCQVERQPSLPQGILQQANLHSMISVSLT